MGGGGFLEEDAALVDFLLSLAPRPRPRVCYLPTPSGDSDRGVAAFFEALSRRECEPSCLRLFGTPERPAEQLAGMDVIYVSGGNTANALALWRLHGVDRALREAWARGAVLGGGSAGANCWFECSVTDSFGRQLEPLRDGLALLPGSFCPHYGSEERRRPAYRALVDEGFPAGYAADDGAALWFEGRDLREAVAARPGARAYRVELGSEEPLTPRAL
jgi:peptidase E